MPMAFAMSVGPTYPAPSIRVSARRQSKPGAANGLWKGSVTSSMPPGPSSRVLAKLKVNGELNILRGHFQQRLLSNRCANPLGGQKALGGPLSEKFMALHVRPPGPDMFCVGIPICKICTRVLRRR
jgi:hypothetical protein